MAETDDKATSESAAESSIDSVAASAPAGSGTIEAGPVDLKADKPDLSAPPPAPVKPPRRASPLWPLLGGVLAAGAGFGLAQYVPQGWPMGSTSTLQSQLADEIKQVQDLALRVQDLSQRLEAATALTDRVAKLEAAPAPTGDVAGLDARLARLEAKPGGVAGDPAELARLQQEIEILKANGAGIVSPEVQASLDAKVKDAETKLAEIEAKAQASGEAVAARAAVRQLAAALDSGSPYTSAVTDLKGASLPAVLTDNAASGLPTLQSLQASFPDAARAALEAALRANMGESWSERVANFLRTQTGARALSPREGNDPDAILSRAEAATNAGDLVTALKEIAALPPEGLAALAPWQARAQTRLDAEAAVQALLQQAG